MGGLASPLQLCLHRLWTALMFWGFIGVALSMSVVHLSIAEMASMRVFQ